MRSSLPPTGTKNPAPRLLVTPQLLLGYSGRPGIGLERIRQINLPYHTKLNKSIRSGSVDTQIPLAGKVALATDTCRKKGGTMCTRAHGQAFILPNTEVLGPEIEEGAFN